MPVAPAVPARPLDSLAVAPAAVVRSRAQMDSATDTQAKLQRAKERFYVLCQLGGWLFFALVQLFFILIFAPPYMDPHKVVVGCVRVITMGLLLTHYIRPWLGAWGWKEMGWRALLPRILLLGF